MIKLLLFGGGGHCRSVMDVIRLTGKYTVVGIIGLPNEKGNVLDGVKFVGDDNDLDHWISACDECLITVGQINSPRIRISIWDRLKSVGATMSTVVSPLAHVSNYAQLSPGTAVMHHAIVNAGSKIGENCIINSKSLIEHDAVIGQHCHISTGAIVNGGTKVGQNSFIGSGAILYQSLHFPDNSIVPAGDIVHGKY